MASFPRKISPMKAVSGDLPTSGEWTYELKWDGMRIIAYIDEGLTLRSGNQIDATVRFPEIAPFAKVFGGKPAVVDGEVIALDDAGRPSFGALQKRMHLTKPTEVLERAATVPVAYQVFDLLFFDGHDLTGLPIEQRRQVLQSVVDDGSAWRTCTVHDDGDALLEVVVAQGLEGLVAKRAGSTYRPGARSPAWRKVKVRREQEFVIGGWTPGSGSRSQRIGALLVGFHDGDGGLRYAGRVGTGFSAAELVRLMAKLQPLTRTTDPFSPVVPPPEARGATFVEPRLVAQLAFAEWSPDRRLRHPAYLGERPDVDPVTVTDRA